MKVIKRDGRKVIFDRNKIKNAILKAFEEVEGEVSVYALAKANIISVYVEDMIKEQNEMSVEEIQNIIEDNLMNEERTKDIARAYIIYRNDRTRIRQKKSQLNTEITKALMASNVQNQNANMDENSFGGRIGAASDAVNKDYALNFCMSPMARKNHLMNEIYTHDLNSYAVGNHNCLSIPFDKLLANGFNTRQTDVRPANSVGTAFQLLAVIFQLQSLQQFGGVSATHLDWTMVPYVRKSFKKHFCDAMHYIPLPEDWKVVVPKDDWSIDCEEYKLFPLQYNYSMDMTKKEIKQAVEGMYHNLNTLQSRSGCQLPFTSINYGTCTLPEGRLVTAALLQGSLSGVGKFHKTSIFPCGIFQCMKEINLNPGEPNYDLFQLAIKSTSQRLYPNYANVDWSGNAGYDRNDPKTYFSTMGCRTANGYDINGFGQLKDGRGNICPVTIIMPTIAMEALDEWNGIEEQEYDIDITAGMTLEDYFLERLDIKIAEARDMLIERFEYICSQNPSSAKFMYENGVMEGYIPEEGIRSALKHGTLAIGNLGLAETLQILIGCDHTTEKGMELAKRIYQLFKDRCSEYKEVYKLNFGVYNTPAENLCHTAMKKFKERYGILPNISENDFFTNSMHVPVWIDMTPIEKINIESQLTGYSSAGCITYVELPGSVKNNLGALETIVRYAMEKDIPYFAVNVPNDTCMNCGYCDEIADTCPQCGSNHIQRLRRVTGYLTGDYVTAFNDGKKQEVKMRKKHIKSFNA